MLAIQIEKRYTKPEIVTLYCNQIPWGHGTYGAEAAARLYFGKPAKDVTLEEAALLAGIIQAPARHSPYVNLHERDAPPQLRARRRWPTPASSPASAPSRRRRRRSSPSGGRPSTPTPPFFVEEVRQQIEERYGAQQLYENGLAVYTTLDLKLQHAAEAALADGMRRIDCRRGFRKPVRIDAAQVESYTHPSWTAWTAKGGVAAGRRVGRRRRDRRRRIDGARARRRAARRAGARRLRLDRARRPAPSSRPATSSRVLVAVGGRRGEADHRLARSGAGVPGRGARGAEPHRPGAGDGRRPQLRAEPLQPHDAGDAAARLDVQADRLRHRDRSRLHAGQHPAGQPGVVVGRRRPAALRAAQLRQEVRGPDHAAARARAVAQRPDRAADGVAQPEHGRGLRRQARVHVEGPAVPLVGARLVRGDAAGSGQRLRRLPEPGRPGDAVRDRPRRRSPGQRARGEPADVDGGAARRHRVRDDPPAARRGRARHGGAGGVARSGRSAARPAPPTTSPTPGSSASIPTSPSASGSATTGRSRSATARAAPRRRCRSGWTS